MLHHQTTVGMINYYGFPYDPELCHVTRDAPHRVYTRPDGSGYASTRYRLHVPGRDRALPIMQPFLSTGPASDGRREFEEFFFVAFGRNRVGITSYTFNKWRAAADELEERRLAIRRLEQGQSRPRKVRSDKLPADVRRAQAAERQRQFRLRRQVKALQLIYPRAPLPMVELLRTVPELLEIYGKKKNNKK